MGGGFKRASKSAETNPAQGSTWTAGREYGQKALNGALVLAVLCGPVALFTAVASGQVKPAMAQVTVEGALTAEQQSAGEYGAAFVAAWLGATRDAPGTLTQYVTASAIRQLSAEPWAYRDLSVVSVAAVDDSDLLSVVAAANVEEFDMKSESGAMIWPRRYFAVMVHQTDEGMSIVGLPAPVAAPVRDTSPVRLAYSQTVPPTSAACSTVEAFLAAYLADSGDITRYITPGSVITPITPAPYMTVTVSDLRSDTEPSDSPSTGSVLHVLAVAEVQNAAGQQLTTTYVFTLTARDGRWETTSVDLAPLENTTPTPSR